MNVPALSHNVEVGRRYSVYRNLGKQTPRAFSVMGSDGRVKAHADLVIIENAEFVVRTAGNAKSKQTGQRNVHAFCRGDVVETGVDGYATQVLQMVLELPDAVYEEVTYHPLKNSSFVNKKTGDHVTKATLAVLVGGKCFADLGAPFAGASLLDDPV